MKFVLAMLAHAVIAFIIGWGILAAVQPDGKPWLLLAGIAAYLVLFWRAGCSEEH